MFWWTSVHFLPQKNTTILKSSNTYTEDLFKHIRTMINIKVLQHYYKASANIESVCSSVLNTADETNSTFNFNRVVACTCSVQGSKLYT